jgi:hypothetical protein
MSKSLRTIACALGSAVAALLVASPLLAQGRKGIAEVAPPATTTSSGRGGFWMSFGAGAGVERLRIEGEPTYDPELWRPTFNVKLGGTLGQNARIGVEAFTWVNPDPDGEVTEALFQVMPILQLYPAKCTGLHLKGGAGWAWSGVTFNSGSSSFSSGTNGFGAMAGIGWELPIGRTVFLTPSLDFYQQWYDGGLDQPDFTERVMNLGVSIGFQTR